MGYGARVGDVVLGRGVYRRLWVGERPLRRCGERHRVVHRDLFGGRRQSSRALLPEYRAGRARRSGPSGERVLRSTSTYINHEFYFDSAHTQLWGSWGVGSSSAYPSGSPAGIQQSVTLNSSGSGTFTYTVYASILANQQSTAPGSYTWTGASRQSNTRRERAPAQPAARRAARVRASPRPSAAAAMFPTDLAQFRFQPERRSRRTSIRPPRSRRNAPTRPLIQLVSTMASMRTAVSAGCNWGRREITSITISIRTPRTRTPGLRRPRRQVARAARARATWARARVRIRTIRSTAGVPAQTAPSAGNYSDTVVVTVTF